MRHLGSCATASYIMLCCRMLQEPKCDCICFLQYTFLLPASKNLPRQVIDFKTGKTKQRNSVGVRMPKDPIVKVCMTDWGLRLALEGMQT